MARLAQGKASRTARITAAMRHRHLLGGVRPLVFEDRFAHLFLDLPSAMAAVPTPLADRALGRLLGPVRGFEGEVLARSRYVEEALAPRLAAGLRQVIVLGAGFDTMALQHAGSGCRFFEVDHPATQAEKRTILATQPQLQPDIAFVPVDFAQDDLANALLAAGFDAARPALVSWLGVTMYLPQPVTVATLSRCAASWRPAAWSCSTPIRDARTRCCRSDRCSRWRVRSPPARASRWSAPSMPQRSPGPSKAWVGASPT